MIEWSNLKHGWCNFKQTCWWKWRNMLFDAHGWCNFNHVGAIWHTLVQFDTPFELKGRHCCLHRAFRCRCSRGVMFAQTKWFHANQEWGGRPCSSVTTTQMQCTDRSSMPLTSLWLETPTAVLVRQKSQCSTGHVFQVVSGSSRTGTESGLHSEHPHLDLG